MFALAAQKELYQSVVMTKPARLGTTSPTKFAKQKLNGWSNILSLLKKETTAYGLKELLVVKQTMLTTI